MSFWDFLRPPVPTKAKGAPAKVKPATAAELQAALGEARAAATAAAERAAEVATARQAFLIAGTDDQLDQSERDLTLANRAVDRAEAAVAALEQRLAEAVEAERLADLDRMFASGEEALDRGLAAYRRYGELAREVASIVGEIKIAAAEVDQARRLLRERGDPRLLPELDPAARPEISSVRLLRTPLWSGVRLPAGDHPQSMIYPPHTALDIPPLPLSPPGESIGPPAEPLPPGWTRWLG